MHKHTYNLRHSVGGGRRTRAAWGTWPDTAAKQNNQLNKNKQPKQFIFLGLKIKQLKINIAAVYWRVKLEGSAKNHSRRQQCGIPGGE